MKPHLLDDVDDPHETLIHQRSLYLFGGMQDFLVRFIWTKEARRRWWPERSDAVRV